MPVHYLPEGKHQTTCGVSPGGLATTSEWADVTCKPCKIKAKEIVKVDIQIIIHEAELALENRSFIDSPENIQKLIKEFMQLIPETMQSAIDNIADDLELQ